MTAKSLLIVGALGLSSVAFAGTKSYDIILNNPTKAGTTELKPGEYKLKVEGTQAVFSRDGQQFTAPVKIQNGAHKFDATTMETSHQGDMETIKAIDLAGSNTVLDFQQ
jgi:hypothetical protein